MRVPDGLRLGEKQAPLTDGRAVSRRTLKLLGLRRLKPRLAIYRAAKRKRCEDENQEYTVLVYGRNGRS